MIRAILLLILAAAAATLLGLAIAEHSGYVLIAWKGLRYESSLWVFLALIVAVWLALLCLRWLLRLLLVSGGLINPWSRRQRARRRQMAADKGLLDLIEGRWERAERHLALAAEGEKQPLMYYLGAARAAYRQGRVEQGEALLEKALRRQPQAELAVALAHAELQREHGDLAGAQETLQAMRERHPRHHLVLDQLQQTLVLRGDWAALLDLLPELRKARILQGEALQTLERRVWTARLQSAAGQGEQALQALTGAWQQLSSAQRQDVELQLAYASQLRALGAGDEAEELLRKALKQGYDQRLIRLYGQLRGRDPARQLQLAEGLLKDHPQDAQLLLALGRLCLQNGLWGKAREYFGISLDFERNAETCAELARLLASLGETEASNRLLLQLLDVQGQHLPALPQP